MWGRGVTVTKEVTLWAQRGHNVHYELAGLPPGQPLQFAIEFNFAGLPPDSADRYFVDAQNQVVADLGRCVDLPAAPSLRLVDRWQGLDVSLAVSEPAGFWAFPICTTSRSQRGLESIQQSVTVMPHWRIVGDATGQFAVDLQLSIVTSPSGVHPRAPQHAPCSATGGCRDRAADGRHFGAVCDRRTAPADRPEIGRRSADALHVWAEPRWPECRVRYRTALLIRRGALAKLVKGASFRRILRSRWKLCPASGVKYLHDRRAGSLGSPPRSANGCRRGNNVLRVSTCIRYNRFEFCGPIGPRLQSLAHAQKEFSMSSSRWFKILVLAALVAVGSLNAASAQQRGFGGRMAGGDGVMILALPAVQKELNLTDAQKPRRVEATDELQASFAGLRDASQEERREKMQGLQEKTKALRAKVEATLEPAQKERLKQLVLQRRGAFGACKTPR